MKPEKICKCRGVMPVPSNCQLTQKLNFNALQDLLEYYGYHNTIELKDELVETLSLIALVPEDEGLVDHKERASCLMFKLYKLFNV